MTSPNPDLAALPVIGAEEVRQLLDIPSTIEAIRALLRGPAEAPARHHHAIQNGPGAPPTVLLLMPAWAAGGQLGIKIATVAPGNAALGLPTVIATYLLQDAATGRPLAIMDGTMLTLRRTAAASALASTFLSRPDSARLLVVGTGALAPHMAEAHAAVRPIRRIEVWGRDLARARRCAASIGDLGLPAAAVADLAPAARRADIISCATTARAPVIRGAWLRPGTHLDLVGSFTPEMREADDAAIAAARVFVDSDESACEEAGDLVQPIAAGVLRRENVVSDLRGLVAGNGQGRSGAGDITLFKSVGMALEDLAAAGLVAERHAGRAAPHG
jgi:alanine dehydrogenase